MIKLERGEKPKELTEEVCEESKDATIDHFLPKSKNPDGVIEWENLFPSCLRCNRKKNNREEKIVNPCEDDPRDYLGIRNSNPFRLKAIDHEGVGKNTIEVLGLNDMTRVIVPRLKEWVILENNLIEIENDLKEEGFKKKYKTRLRKIMEHCLPYESYSAVKATNILNHDTYKEIKNILIQVEQWSADLESLEEAIRHIALKVV